ncbi:hypothetical protein KY312_04230 [Candidatus Woesearchaeota archaeon]|nr:hypothetical protein [Candidatus Woesearchaeota archaeon]
MKHHLLKSSWHIEGNKIICSYCREPVDLEDEHCIELHYKTTICKCGKKIIMKIPFLGSGHDNFIKSKLEEKMEK